MRVGIATDHGGFKLKQGLIPRLCMAGHAVVDFGAHSLCLDDDYPDVVIPLAHAVVAGKVDRGVAWDLVQAFLAAQFSQAGRHLRRQEKMARIEI